MKNKKSDFITEDIGDRIKQEPLDHEGKVKGKRSKWLRWLLNIIDSIVTALT
jgi:hypothetical protein